jgi:cell division protein FtsI (penicillin-binding protein 3)
MYRPHRSIENPVVQKRKINMLLVIFAGLFIIILFKLVKIQIFESEKYKIAARKQYENKIILAPSRGMIFDRNMNVLVSNTYEFSFAADPNMIDKPDEVAEIFSKNFGKDKQEYLDKLHALNTSFIYLERRVPTESVNGLDTLMMNGLIVLKEPKRIYNYGSLASQVVGYTNIENKGQTGIELCMDRELAGREGFIIMQRDGRGNIRPVIEYPRKDPENGNNIVLTIDINIQRFLEEELKNGVMNYNAELARGVVMAVETGEILAMATYPDFDPNNISSSDTIGMRNSVITDIQEPGSTFKLITAAASLEEKIESRNSIIATESGSYEINGVKIRDSHGSSSMSFQQVIEQSSNIGMSKIARKLGPERFYKYARDFGFGINTGIELPGENKGILKKPIDFSPVSLPYLSFGYEVLSNTMQLTNAYATIANDGMMMKPFIIKRETGRDGKVIFENSPAQLRQVVSKNTASTLTSLLVGVIERGTGKNASVEGVNVAGKTGTAQRLVNGKYSSASHNGSFIGYFPAEDPKIIIAIILNNPRSGGYYGGTVAAPIFSSVATRVINFTGTEYSSPDLFYASMNKIEDNINDEVKNPEGTVIPNLINLKLGDAIDILNEKKIGFEVFENDQPVRKDFDFDRLVEEQYPQPLMKLMNSGTGGQTITLHISHKSALDEFPLRTGENNKPVSIPDVKNLSLRKAINLLIAQGFEVEIIGSGRIISQSPEAGSKTAPARTGGEFNTNKITIYCKNDL